MVFSKLWGINNLKNRVCQTYTFTIKAVANAQVKTFNERRIRAASVYALKKAKDVPALKAVSQNLRHSNLSITGGVYGVLSENDVGEIIQSLGMIHKSR